MMVHSIAREKILQTLKELTGHSFIELTTRGNAAITAALSILKKGEIKQKTILIPEEGGWIHYQKAPHQLGLEYETVACTDAKINLDDLKRKLNSKTFGAFLYQNPGGYFAEQPMKDIYDLCKKNDCLVILDVSGSIGTALCDGRYADIILGSFGEGKLVEAHVGGFISSNFPELFQRINQTVKVLSDESSLKIIGSKLEELDRRINSLLQTRKKILKELREINTPLDIVHPHDLGFVIVVKWKTEEEKQTIINYCRQQHLPFTECPRYIRLNSPAISIEVKQLESSEII